MVIKSYFKGSLTSVNILITNYLVATQGKSLNDFPGKQGRSKVGI